MDQSYKDGGCYKRHMEALIEMGASSNPVLVHGDPIFLGTNPPERTGTRYGHAWIEIKGFVLDLVAEVVMPADAYYASGSIIKEDCARYNLKQARDALLEHEHWGPWHRPPHRYDTTQHNTTEKT